MYLSSVEKVILIAMCILLVAMSLIVLFFSSACHAYYDYIEPIRNPEFHKIGDNLYIDFIAEDEEFIAEQVAYYLEFTKLYENDYYIIITGENLIAETDYSNNAKAAGLTNCNKKVIRIKYGFLDYALFHEIGHAVDNTYGFSSTKEFEVLYEKVKPKELYKPSCLDEYMTLNIKEYFAENYKRYISHELTDQEVIEYFDKITKDYSD